MPAMRPSCATSSRGDAVSEWKEFPRASSRSSSWNSCATTPATTGRGGCSASPAPRRTCWHCSRARPQAAHPSHTCCTAPTGRLPARPEAGLLTLCNARVRRGPQILLDEATATIFRCEKIGIGGRNGGGKSTLLALIRGELTPDAGEYSAPPDLAIAWVAQELPDSDRPLLEYILDGDVELRAVEAQLARAHERGEGALEASLHARYEALGGYAARSRAAQLAAGLGFDSADPGRVHSCTAPSCCCSMSRPITWTSMRCCGWRNGCGSTAGHCCSCLTIASSSMRSSAASCTSRADGCMPTRATTAPSKPSTPPMPNAPAPWWRSGGARRPTSRVSWSDSAPRRARRARYRAA